MTLVDRPSVIFLDEPTTGLDPRSRLTMWQIIRELVSAGVTILLTTQYLIERQEPGGRRRKCYTPTDRGYTAFEDWLRVVSANLYMLRDLALLKLFFGADAGRLAEVQLPTHQQRLSEYEALSEQIASSAPAGPRLALELGIRHERETVRFWSEHVPSEARAS